MNTIFYNRYKACFEAMAEIVDDLFWLNSLSEWSYILDRERGIKKQLEEIERYDIKEEFECFALLSEPNKVSGFFKTVDSQINWLILKWNLHYNQEDDEYFEDWFYKLVYEKFSMQSNDADRIARLIKQANTCLYSLSNKFEQIKTTYTNLPPKPKVLFYERIKRQLVEDDVNYQIQEYTCEDWKNKNIDEVLIRYYVITGQNIKPLIWPNKWEYFNKWIEVEFKYNKASFYNDDNYSLSQKSPYDTLINMIINRIMYHEGNPLQLFIHALKFFTTEEIKKIDKLTIEIHNKTVSDNWYYLKSDIDYAIRGSIDWEKLVTMLIESIDQYLENKESTLVYPLHKTQSIDQQEVVAAYDSMLRGVIETRYVRPVKQEIPAEGPIMREDITGNKSSYNIRSPFVVAELLLKSRDYLKVQLVQSKPLKNTQCSANNTLSCTLTEWQMSNLFSRLLADKYIGSNTNLADFSNALLGSESIDKPIKWEKGNRDLGYLFTTMFERGMINNSEWKSVVGKRGLFINKRGKSLTSHDLTSAVSEYLKCGLPGEAMNLETILREVKP